MAYDRDYTSLVDKINNILEVHNQQLRVVSYNKPRVVLSNGNIVEGVVEVRKLRAYAYGVNINHFDDIYAYFDVAERDIFRKSVTAKRSSDYNKQWYTELSPEKKAQSIAHMQHISVAGRAASLEVPPRTRGKNKDNCEVIANYAAKLSRERMGADNPAWGKSPSPESRKKQSDTLRAKIASGEFTPCTHNSKTRLTRSIGANRYRSSWEVVYAYLNPSDEYETLRIQYSYKDSSRTYIVDFVNHEKRAITEIKPSAHCAHEKTIAKFNAAHLWAAVHGYEFRVYGEEYMLHHASLVDYNKVIIPNYKVLLRKFL